MDILPTSRGQNPEPTALLRGWQMLDHAIRVEK